MPEPSSELGLLNAINQATSWDDTSSNSYAKDIQEALLAPGASLEHIFMRGQIAPAYLPAMVREFNRGVESMKRKAARDSSFKPPKEMVRWMNMPARMRTVAFFELFSASVAGRARTDAVSAFVGQSARAPESMGGKLKKFLGMGKGSKANKGMSE